MLAVPVCRRFNAACALAVIDRLLFDYFPPRKRPFALSAYGLAMILLRLSSIASYPLPDHPLRCPVPHSARTPRPHRRRATATPISNSSSHLPP
ncbi:MAG: hypothetical protein NTV52_01460 [Acidobacteria bacterium]|nr:hypothetical protein [Acidobacteriota bacterium]